MKVKLGFQTNIGSIVQKTRKEKNITQEQLAEYCGLSSRAIIKIEKGETDIKLSTILKLVSLLGLDLTLEDRKVTKR